jgi:hypothetical protein
MDKSIFSKPVFVISIMVILITLVYLSVVFLGKNNIVEVEIEKIVEKETGLTIDFTP